MVDSFQTPQKPVRGQLISERIKLFSNHDDNVATFFPKQKSVISSIHSPTKFIPSANLHSFSSLNSKPVYSNEQLYCKPGNIYKSNSVKSNLSEKHNNNGSSYTASSNNLHQNFYGKRADSEVIVKDIEVLTKEEEREEQKDIVNKYLDSHEEQSNAIDTTNDICSDNNRENFKTFTKEFNGDDFGNIENIIESPSETQTNDYEFNITHYQDESNVTSITYEDMSTRVDTIQSQVDTLAEISVEVSNADARLMLDYMASTPLEQCISPRSEKTTSVNYGTLKRKLFSDFDEKSNIQTNIAYSEKSPSNSVPTLFGENATQEVSVFTTLSRSVEELLKLNIDTLAEMENTDSLTEEIKSLIVKEDNWKLSIDNIDLYQFMDFRNSYMSTLDSLINSFKLDSTLLITEFEILTNTDNKGKKTNDNSKAQIDKALTVLMTVCGKLESIYKFAGELIGINILIKCTNLLNVCVNDLKIEFDNNGVLQSISELDKTVKYALYAVKIVRILYNSELKNLPVSFSKNYTIEATSFGTPNAPDEFNMENFYKNYQLEYLDLGSVLYKTSFAGNRHENYMGNIPSLGGLIILSLMANTSPEGIVEYWAIIRAKDRADVRLVLSPKEVTGIKRYSKQEKRAVLQSIDGELNFSKLVKITDMSLEKKLISLDEINIPHKFKFGVLYGRGSQSSEEEMLNNEDGSQEFKQFLSILGNEIDLKGFSGYAAGLDTKSGLTGDKSIYSVWRNQEIMFHVSTLLPYQKDDVQQIARKRHIGNDIITVVYLDEDSVVDLSTFKSQFLHVFFIVRKDSHSRPGEVGYRIYIVRNSDVPYFGPCLPIPPIFYDRESIREFIIGKMINAECASYKAPKFSTPHTRTRNAIIDDLIQSFSPILASRRPDSLLTKAEIKEYTVKEQQVQTSIPLKIEGKKSSVFLSRLRRKSSNTGYETVPVQKTVVLTRSQGRHTYDDSHDDTSAKEDTSKLQNDFHYSQDIKCSMDSF